MIVAVMRGKNAVDEERYVECTVMVLVGEEIQIRRVHSESDCLSCSVSVTYAC